MLAGVLAAGVAVGNGPTFSLPLLNYDFVSMAHLDAYCGWTCADEDGSTTTTTVPASTAPVATGCLNSVLQAALCEEIRTRPGCYYSNYNSSGPGPTFCEYEASIDSQLEFWAPGGRLAYLVRTKCIDQVFLEYNRDNPFTIIVSSYENFKDSPDVASFYNFFDCLGDSDREVAIARLDDKIARAQRVFLSLIEGRTTLPGTFSPEQTAYRSAVADDNWQCGVHMLEWRSIHSQRDSVFELELCATYFKTAILVHQDMDAFASVGCIKATEGDDTVIVPFVEIDGTDFESMCTALHSGSEGDPREASFSYGIGCYNADPAIFGIGYRYTFPIDDGDDDAADVPLASEFFTASSDDIGRMVFRCTVPWFPRGEISGLMATKYVDVDSDGGDTVLSAVLPVPGRQACADACSTTLECGGYAWEATASSVCRLAMRRTVLPDRFPGVSNQVRLAMTEDAPRTFVTSVGDQISTKRFGAHSGGNPGPWSSYGFADRSALAAVGPDPETDRVSRLGPDGLYRDGTTASAPDGCATACGARPACLYAIWLSSIAPCLFQYAADVASAPAPAYVRGGTRCGRFSDGLDPATPETTLICNSVPGCTFVGTVCTDIAASDVEGSALSVDSSGGQVLPVVYTVPEQRPDSAAPPSNRAASPEGTNCTKCSLGEATAECATAAAIVVPEGVTDFTETDFSGCTSLRTVTILAPAPHFEPGSFGGCPLLEKISFASTKCGTDPATECSATLEPGAVPTCVGPVAGRFGFSTTYSGAQDCESASDCTGCVAEAGGKFRYVPESSITALAASAFSGCEQLVSIDLNRAQSLTEIPDNAFSAALNLVSADLGDTITTIGPRAFYRATSLVGITGGSSVLTISEAAFEESGAVPTMPAWASLATLKSEAFLRSESSSISTGPTLVDVPARAFEKSAVYVLEIGANVETIGIRACNECEVLRAVEISSTVLREIGDGAFSGCPRLEVFVVPESAQTGFTLGTYAFADTNSLSAFRFPSDVTEFDFATAAPRSACWAHSSFTFEGGETFYNCTKLVYEQCNTGRDCSGARAIRPITDVPESAFYSDVTLKSVKIASTVPSIGTRAFSHCMGIEQLIVEQADTSSISFGESAFRFVGFSVLDLSTRRASIGSGAFSDSMIRFADLSRVTEIGEFAFSECSQLATVKFDQNLVSIGADAFSGCRQLRTLQIPASITSIGNNAFLRTNALRVVVLEDATHVPVDAFAYSPALDTVIIDGPNGYSDKIKYSGCGTPKSTSTNVCFCDNGDCPSISQPATPKIIPHTVPPLYVPYTPHVGTISLASAIDCIPCAASSSAVYSAGRANIPDGIKEIGTDILADCPGVTSVSVPADAIYTVDEFGGSWRSTFLESFTPRLPAGDDPVFNGYVPRCMMNQAVSTQRDAAGAFGSLVTMGVEPQLPLRTFDCVPCGAGFDLTVPSAVTQIPPYSFSGCLIPGTLRFSIPVGASLTIFSNAFDMTTDAGGTLGAVVVPAVDVGVGAFKSDALTSFLVASSTAWNKGTDYLKERIDLGGCETLDDAFPAEAVTNTPAPGLSDLATAQGCGDSAAAVLAALPSSDNEYASLYGTCRCAPMEPGCFTAEHAEPTVVLPMAKADVCGGEEMRIGPVYLPIHSLLLPGGLSDQFLVTQPASLYLPAAPEGCTVSMYMRYGATASDGGNCTVCDHAETCVSALHHYPPDAVAEANSVPPPIRPTLTTTPPPEAPRKRDTGPGAGVWVAVGISSLVVLVFIWRVVMRRFTAKPRTIQYSPVPSKPAPKPLVNLGQS
jgi:hypothetical protein